jgi:FimV-like protein
MRMNICWMLCAAALGVVVPAEAATLGPVTTKDTLWSLARAARGDAPYSMYQAIVALQLKNPTAFIGQNVHHVKLGAVLELPTAAEIAAVNLADAQQKVESDAALVRQWAAARQAGTPALLTEGAVAKKPTGLSSQATAALARAVQQRSQAQRQASTAPQRAAITVPISPVDTDNALADQSTAPLPPTPAAPDIAEAPAVLARAAEADWTERLQTDTTLGVDWRWFPSGGSQGQSRSALSANALVEWYWQSADEKNSWTISPYLRWDQRDKERHQVDLRQAFWLTVGDGWEFKAGVDKIFWGVTESIHLVDIINQTDWADAIDGESKLGQPLAQLTLTGDWGNLQSFVLPYFRERTFAGVDGRLRLPLPVLTDAAIYQSDAQQRHIDWALRYSQQIDQVDLALSYFSGTNRDPRFMPQGQGAALLPYYEQIRQFGVEGQWIVDSWIWKLEAIRRSSDIEHFTAAVAGFEYSTVGAFDSAIDLGWLLEYQYDNRGTFAPVPGQRDVFAGLRIALNDEAGSELLFGIAQDLQSGGTRSGMLEASMRFSNNLRIRLDAWFFQAASLQQPTWWLRQDDYIQLGVDYYF